MSKYSFLVAGLLTATMLSTSSASAAEKPSFGVLGGLHLANLAIDPDPTDATLDFMRRANIGGFVELGLARHAALQARCMYVQKGAAFREVIEDVNLRATAVLDYITVPVLVKIHGETAGIRPYAFIGPELGFKTGTGASAASADVPGQILNMVEKNLSDQFDDYSKSTDIALDFGGGIEIPAGRVSIPIEGTYSLGLRNIAIPSEGENGSAKTRTFLLNVGVRF
jgi:hypothetical protein